MVIISCEPPLISPEAGGEKEGWGKMQFTGILYTLHFA